MCCKFVHGCNIKVLLFWFGPELAASWPVLLGGQAQWTVGLLATIISISTIIAADTGAFLGGRVCSFWSPPVPIPNSSQRSVEFRDHLLLPFHLLWFRCGHMVIFVSLLAFSVYLSVYPESQALNLLHADQCLMYSMGTSESIVPGKFVSLQTNISLKSRVWTTFFPVLVPGTWQNPSQWSEP